MHRTLGGENHCVVHELLFRASGEVLKGGDDLPLL